MPEIMFLKNITMKTDNKKIWGIVKPFFFSNKVRSKTYITLNEDEHLTKNKIPYSQHF